MRIKIACSFCAIAVLLCGCDQDKNARKEANRCELHQSTLVELSGFAPSEDLMISPGQELSRFLSLKSSDFPNMRPWWFSDESHDELNGQFDVTVCDECTVEFEKEFEAYMNLSIAERERLEIEFLQREAEKITSGEGSTTENHEWMPADLPEL